LITSLRYVSNKIALDFGNYDGSGGAHLDTALTTQAFFFVHRDGLAILHLKDAGGTNIDALFIAGALIRIDFHTPTHYFFLL
jgi:hypothetical protein